MDPLVQNKLDYQKKYGILKDYIVSTKSIKYHPENDNYSSTNNSDDPQFNNKKLIAYLEDSEDNSLKIDQQEKEDVIMESCFMIERGFNVCLHGFGSKINVIEQISSYYKNVPRVIVKGYSPASSIQQMASKIKYGVAKILKCSSTTSKKSESIIEYLESKQGFMDEEEKIKFILVVFHNLDGKQFVDGESVKLLARIFRLSYIRVICSVEHVKWGIAVSSKTLEKMNLAFLQCNTYERYIKQFSITGNTFHFKKENEGEALKYILRSFTKIQKEIIQLLAAHILKSTEQAQSGLSLSELLEACIDEMILNSEQQLRENLLEIIDHKVFLEKKMPNSSKPIYTVPFNKEILQKIVDNKLEEDDEAEENDDDNNQDDEDEDEEAKRRKGSESIDEEEDEEKKKPFNKKKKNKALSSSDSSIASEDNEEEEEEEEEREIEKVEVRKKRKYVKKAKNKIAQQIEEERDEEEQEENDDIENTSH